MPETHRPGYPVWCNAALQNSSVKPCTEEVSEAVYRAFSPLGDGPYAPCFFSSTYHPAPIPHAEIHRDSRQDLEGGRLRVAEFCKTLHESFW